MDKYRTFMLAAAPGFGKPQIQESNKKSNSNSKLTKDQIARWRAKPEKFREEYLKTHPNSRFKNIPVRGTIITRSKRTSSRKEAKNVAASGAAFLTAIGMRAGKISQEKGLEVLQHLQNFRRAKDRQPYVDKAVAAFNKYKGKLSKKDQMDIDQEAKDIQNNPRERPSKTLDRKGHRGKLPALIGTALAVGMLGSLAIVSPDIALYLGVKALDLAIDSSRKAVDEPIAAFFAGHTIASFFKSKDSDEYVDNVDKKMSKQYDPYNRLDEEKQEGEKENDTNDSDNTLKNAVAKKIPNFDTSKYEQDENGNLKRKRDAENKAT